MAVADTADARREALKEVYARARACTRCAPLAASRTQVVFGAGNADADLMFIGEAPGRHEDEQGVPFVGAAGKLLSTLLEGIGLAREDVFIANVLKCRPPENRNPEPQEIANCSEYLFAQLDLIRPVVVVTLGNFATRLIRDDPTGITRLRGRAEIRTIGPRTVRLLPSLHPAAALYTAANREVIAGDFALIPGLMALGPPEQTAAGEPVEDAHEPEPLPAPEPEPPAATPAVPPSDEPQLGLF
jgi:DNA polymerase